MRLCYPRKCAASSCASLFAVSLSRGGEIGKYFAIEKAGSNGSDTADGSFPTYDSGPLDFEGTRMQGLPFAGSLTKFTFCLAPSDYCGASLRQPLICKYVLNYYKEH